MSKWEGKDEGGVVEKKVELEVVAGKCDSNCVCVSSVRVQGFLNYTKLKEKLFIEKKMYQ